MMFEDLEAWQQARQLVNEIYSLTRENSSLRKDFGLTGQVQRAAVSIMSNVAEGFERTHLPEKIQFYNIARGSTGEVRSLLYVISDNYPTITHDQRWRRNAYVAPQSQLGSSSQAFCGRPRDGKADSHEHCRFYSSQFSICWLPSSDE
jgi:four helix bundle protein